jgi:uncharacterized membrane protein
MAKESLHLVAASYSSTEAADTILKMIQDMKKAGRINIEDAAVVTKTDDGKLKVEETKELTGRKGARRGAIILGAIGLIFPPSFIASVLVGGGVGALAGKLRDSGIKTDQFEQFANDLQPGQAAVLVLAHSESVTKIHNSLEGYDGMIITQEIDADAAAKLAESMGGTGDEEAIMDDTAASEMTTETPSGSAT